MAIDPVTRAAIGAHQEWLGFVQPVGLVVAPPVLVARGVLIDRNIRPHQERLDALLNDDDAAVADIKSVFVELLGWEEEDLADPDPAQQIRLPELEVTLEPTWQVKDREGAAQLLIRSEPGGTALDDPVDAAIPGAARQGRSGDGWTAPPQLRFERLLRETGIAAGLLCTPEVVRLVYAPAGETSGHLTFRIADMAQVMGRPILAAFTLLLGEFRMFRAEPAERLTGLLAESRIAQNTVSTRLARQVLGALHALLRGFVATDFRRAGDAAATTPGQIARLAADDPQFLYAGLVTVLMRLVFVLYAEDRDLMPADRLYEENYGLRGLFKKLRDDAARHGEDLMDRRYGAWARLLALFRLIHSGGGRDAFRFTPRKGRLFDPDRFPFLEGRAAAADPVGTLPLLSDGTLWRVLERLLVLDGERLSYRTLDVEEIGSVYQAVMGFRIERRPGRALILRSKSHHGAGVIVDIDALLADRPADRKKRLGGLEVAALAAREERAVAEAGTVEVLAEALAGKLDADATPALMPAGQPLLQATDERRRSGSHYTPRSLTKPIVAETLRPILGRLGPRATPDEILALKVLDPAMGSGAFLVEASRQLAEALVTAWDVHGVRPEVPRDEDALLYAKRLVVQRCLYGVDRNELAAELGKLSLWLATLARDHEFSFLDHCVRHGDSLVGLDRRQIEALSWTPQTNEAPLDLLHMLLRDRLAEIEREREHIRAALDDAHEDELRLVLARAERALSQPKLIGDAVIAAFFSAYKARAREEARLEVRAVIEQGGRDRLEALLPAVDRLRTSTPVPAQARIVPFHWPLEFPEVFDRVNPGFDAVVGNPPFAGKNTTIAVNAEHYVDWLQTSHPGAHGNSDIVAHFFRRAYGLLRDGGCLGLLATNTIRQGDTRATGLRPIRQAGGTVYMARRRCKWPGEAAVTVSLVHIAKGFVAGPYRLDGRSVPVITAFLFYDGGDDDPRSLRATAGLCYRGAELYGLGFTFDDTDKTGVANSTQLMRELIAKDRRNAERIVPYIGGEEVNETPDQSAHRWAINFEDYPLTRNDGLPSWDRCDEKIRLGMLRQGVVPTDYPGAVGNDWPDLLGIVEQKVKPERMQLGDTPDAKRRKTYWWRWGRPTPDLFEAVRPLKHTLVMARVSKTFGLTFVKSEMALNDMLVVFASESIALFGLLQSRVHEIWARLFASSLEDRLRYTPTDCFETFPFPPGFQADPQIESSGKQYYDFRAALMTERNEGLTTMYNRFHDPDERSNAIGELRRLHDAMDRAVLDTYAWADIRPTCEFELEWQDDGAENARQRKKPWRYQWSEAGCRRSLGICRARRRVGDPAHPARFLDGAARSLRAGEGGRPDRRRDRPRIQLGADYRRRSAFKTRAGPGAGAAHRLGAGVPAGRGA